MFRLLLFIALLISSVMPGFTQSVNSQRYSIRYVDKIKTGNVNFENQKLPAKARRLSSNKGNINLVYFDEVPDSMKVALSAAATLWEAKISNRQPIYIGIFFEPLSSDVAMESEVYYFSDTRSELLGCPLALASQLLNEQYESEDNPDGIIVLNSDINWVCNFSGTSTDTYNVTTIAMRGIARTLGFGSSIIPSGKNFDYYCNWPTYYDKYLCNDTQFLTELEQESNDMANFVKSDNVFFNSSSDLYKIYAPFQYNPELSLNYFEDNNSLMSYLLGKGNCRLAIDDKTINVLRTIGWDFPEKGLKIKSVDIADDGIASSYTSHTFYLDKGENTVTNYQWKFLLKNKSGQFEQISTGKDEEFTIEKINLPGSYFVNINGDHEGRIECSYTINGVDFSAMPLSISLELKPMILSIYDVEKHYVTLDEYYLTFNVTYTGADYLKAKMEEDYSFGKRIYWNYEPYIAHVKTGTTTDLFYCWVTVEVSNEYGTIEETLEFEPEYDKYNLLECKYNVKKAESSFERVGPIQIFSSDGVLMYNGDSSALSDYKLSPGIYFKREMDSNGLYMTTKIIVR
ncbi:MAG: hypothetical protein HDS52_02020 [Barnesiella sp.]|nr:hypothetical protein [Barnesiella sp.]